MIPRSQVKQAQRKAAKILDRAGIVLTPTERKNIEVAEFGLGELERTGLELITYVNTDRYCADEIERLVQLITDQLAGAGKGN